MPPLRPSRNAAGPGELSGKQTPASVDRYFEVTLLLMLGTGFVTLASTGKWDLVSVALLGLALAVWLWGYAGRRDLRLSPRVVSRLAIFYVLFFVLDFLIFSSGLTLLDRMLRVTAHLALFTAVIKLYARFAISTLVSFEIKHSMGDSARKVNGPVVVFQ